MSPYRYQLTIDEFVDEFQMSKTTYYRRLSYAKTNYPDWYLVYLPSGRIDIKEYQKFETWRSQKLWESKADPRLRLKREGVI